MKKSFPRTASALALVAMTALGSRPSLGAPPPNDDIANAVVVTEPLPFSASTSTVEATTAADDPLCAGNGPTVWYAFTPTTSGFIQANTGGSDYDTTLSAYTGSPGSLVRIACNDDSPDLGLQSRVIISVTAGVTYRFMVGAFASGPGGNLVFNVAVLPPPAVVNLTITEPVSVEPRTGTATVLAQVHASSPVFLFSIDSFLVQPTGRGNVIASGFAPVFDTTASFDAVLTLKDQLALRTRGTGFVGGPARLQVSLFYFDPAAGFQFISVDREVVLTGPPRH